MQILKIELDIDLANEKQVSALNMFTRTLNDIAAGNETVDTPTPKKDAPKPAKEDKEEPAGETKTTKRKRRTKEQIAADKAAAAAKAAAEEAGDDGDPDGEGEDNEYTLEEVRAKLSEKVKTHKDQVVAKMKELDAKNISALDEDDYTEFYEFLDALK